MLESFTFKNHGPFREENTIDMRAIESYKEHAYNLANVNGDKIIKVAVIYGANAAGKSQFVDAYRNFRYLVVYSFRDASSDRHIVESRHTPFMFCVDEGQETEYEGVYACDEGMYQYGFSFNADSITSEWLYFTSATTHRRSMVIERKGDSLSFGASVRGECKKYAANIRGSVLALSFMANVKLETEVFDSAFRNITDVLTITSRMCTADISYLLRDYFSIGFDENEKKRLLRFLESIDVEIKDIEVKQNGRDIQVYTKHVGYDGGEYEAPLEIESDGTKKVISLYSRFRTAVERNKGIIVDELDSQLHPVLLRSLVNLFYDQKTQGQLIYTCHTTEFLSNRYVRRDQVWFVDKEEGGQSSLYSLAEFKPRNDASLSLSYLSGRYGAIPNIDEVEMGYE